MSELVLYIPPAGGFDPELERSQKADRLRYQRQFETQWLGSYINKGIVRLSLSGLPPSEEEIEFACELTFGKSFNTMTAKQQDKVIEEYARRSL